jgi:23S rRNA pseudoU1915 N3-methylase RlmH
VLAVDFQKRVKVIIPLIDSQDEKVGNYIYSYLNTILTYFGGVISSDGQPNFIIVDNPEIFNGNELDLTEIKKKYSLNEDILSIFSRNTLKIDSCGVNIQLKLDGKLIFSAAFLSNELSFREKIRCVNLVIGGNLGFNHGSKTREDLLLLPANVLAVSAINVCQNEVKFSECVEGVVEAYFTELRNIFKLEEKK